jgi:phage terminase large subunit
VPAALQTDKVTVPAVYIDKSVYNITGWPKQKLFHASRAKYRLQVGGYGSGKSRPLLWEAIFHALEYPGSNSLILRKTIPDLKRTVIDKFLSDVPKRLYQFYNQTDHIVYFHPDPITGKQSKLYLSACERDEDVGKFLSTEYVYIGFEELGEFSFAVWDALKDRNRCPIPGSRACMAAATNPTGVGWGWIKKLWIQKKPFIGMDPAKYDPNDYEYIHSTVDDNPIYSKDAEYIKSLESGPARDVRRWGKMDGVTGNYFDNWDETRHRRPSSEFIFEKWQPIWIGWDYGFSHYGCIVFMTKAIKKRAPVLPRMVNVVLGELVLQENTPREQAEALLLCLKEEDRARVESVHFSWERFMRTTSNFTVADEVDEILSAGGLPKTTPSNKDRVAGWMKCYSLLDTDEVYLLEDTTLSAPATSPSVLAESIPSLSRNPKNLEDILKPPGVSLPDDIGDAWRYAIAGTLLDEEDKPPEVRLREKLASIEEPMARHAEAFKHYLKEKKKSEQDGLKYVPTWMKKIQ